MIAHESCTNSNSIHPLSIDIAAHLVTYGLGVQHPGRGMEHIALEKMGALEYEESQRGIERQSQQ